MKEKRKKLKEKAKQFFKENWEIIVGIGLGTVVGLAWLKKHSDHKYVVNSDGMEEMDEIFYNIDEAIFTDLAPKIENAVLDRGVEKLVVEDAYDLGDNLSKSVTITVENVYGD